MSKLKVVVFGHVETQPNFTKALKKMAALNRSNGPFDVGFISIASGVDPKGDAPFPLYVLGTVAHQAKSENSIHVINKAELREIKGLLVGFAPKQAMGNEIIKEFAPRLNSDPTANNLDIFISFQWPDLVLTGVESDAAVKEKKERISRRGKFSEEIKRALSRLKPRYHFAFDREVFLERTPYSNCHDHPSLNPTRFFGLGLAFDPLKEKFLYALNLTPLSVERPAETTGPITVCPYIEKNFVQKKAKMEEIEQKFLEKNKDNIFSRWGVGITEKKNRQQKQREEKEQNKNVQITQDNCWFCFTNFGCETHLVAYVGNGFYMAKAKGGFHESHMLLIPLEHTPTLSHDLAAKFRSIKHYLFDWCKRARPDQQLIFWELCDSAKKRVHYICHFMLLNKDQLNEEHFLSNFSKGLFEKKPLFSTAPPKQYFLVDFGDSQYLYERSGEKTLPGATEKANFNLNHHKSEEKKENDDKEDEKENNEKEDKKEKDEKEDKKEDKKENDENEDKKENDEKEDKKENDEKEDKKENDEKEDEKNPKRVRPSKVFERFATMITESTANSSIKWRQNVEDKEKESQSAMEWAKVLLQEVFV